MKDASSTLSRDQRDAIMKALKAIERRVKDMKPHWQDLYVIGTNLAIIQMNITTPPRASSN